eukprot:933332-Pyramimonas_sp.AAC.1
MFYYLGYEQVTARPQLWRGDETTSCTYARQCVSCIKAKYKTKQRSAAAYVLLRSYTDVLFHR